MFIIDSIYTGHHKICTFKRNLLYVPQRNPSIIDKIGILAKPNLTLLQTKSFHNTVVFSKVQLFVFFHVHQKHIIKLIQIGCVDRRPGKLVVLKDLIENLYSFPVSFCWCNPKNCFPTLFHLPNYS